MEKIGDLMTLNIPESSIGSVTAYIGFGIKSEISRRDKRLSKILIKIQAQPVTSSRFSTSFISNIRLLGNVARRASPAQIREEASNVRERYGGRY